MKVATLTTLIIFITCINISAQKKITTQEAADNIGTIVTVCDKIVDARYLENSPGKFTLLNIGGRFPNQKLTIVINEINRNNFPLRPELFYLNKTVCVTGKLTLYRQKPQIQITSPTDIYVSAEPSETTGSANQPPTPNTPTTPRKDNNSRRDNNYSFSRLTPPILHVSNVTYVLGASVGTMHGVTDVGRKESSAFLPSTVDWKSTKLNASAFAGLVYKDVVGARLNVTYGRVAGDDKNGLYADRRLSYRSSIFEIAALGEYYPLRDKPFSPYVTAGVGFFTFNPQTKYKDNWVDLKPLRTEGQGFAEYPDRSEYKLTSLCLPFGLGLRYKLSERVNMKFEGLYRYTFTDYLDDASKTYIEPSLFAKYLPSADAVIAAAVAKPNTQFPLSYRRGGTKSKDKYFSLNVGLELKLY